MMGLLHLIGNYLTGLKHSLSHEPILFVISNGEASPLNYCPYKHTLVFDLDNPHSLNSTFFSPLLFLFSSHCLFQTIAPPFLSGSPHHRLPSPPLILLHHPQTRRKSKGTIAARAPRAGSQLRGARSTSPLQLLI